MTPSISTLGVSSGMVLRLGIFEIGPQTMASGEPSSTVCVSLMSHVLVAKATFFALALGYSYNFLGIFVN